MNYTFNNFNKPQYPNTSDVPGSERHTQAGSEPTPEVAAEIQPDVQTETHIQHEEVQVESRHIVQPEVRVEARPEVQSQPEVQVAVRPEVQPQVETPAVPQAETKTTYRTEIEPVYIQTKSRIPLEKLSITKTPKTPEVMLDPRQGKYSISGRSLPEDAVAFYQRIISWLERFHASHSFETEVRFELELEYFNTSSSKCLLNVFKEISRMHDAGKNVSIVWRYDEDDEDMEETGEDYRDLLSVPFTLEGIEY